MMARHRRTMTCNAIANRDRRLMAYEFTSRVNGKHRRIV